MPHSVLPDTVVDLRGDHMKIPTFDLCSTSAFNLTGLLAACLGEDGEKDDPPAGSEPLGDPRLTVREREAQLTHFASKVSGVRLAERLGLLGEKVRQSFDLHVVALGQRLKPRSDLGLDLDDI
jgi:hypothetical protein